VTVVRLNWFRASLSPRLFALILLTAVSACSDPPTSPSAVTQTDVVAGTGTEAVSGKVLTVNYTGWLYNSAQPEGKGAQFDSSLGSTPFIFTLGQGGVISGWDTGLVGMKVGGLRRLVIPPSLGYGGIRNGLIPPNATLLFEIELLNVQ
jgi:FKBP-type peptidyl-prolyl cis-trans isomerase FkpA